MTRIFPDYAYGDGPRGGCWWDETCEVSANPSLSCVQRADVAIVGAGFTGLSAALHLAQAGVNVVILDAEYSGWGASGRNGGFCCLGGGMLDDADLDARFGRSGRLEFRAAEKSAVVLVAQLIEALGLDVEMHSNGETELAHRPKDMHGLRMKAEAVEENYGVEARIVEPNELDTEGLGGPFHGALTIPIGFALNPLKYLAGLAKAAAEAGARIFHNTRVRHLGKEQGCHRLATDKGQVSAQHVIIATNGYSSEDIPPWLAGRYMPGQSTVLVTRPLSPAERDAQGWHSDQMCYDTRHLLHYFRLMPDGRFLFGMRGGLASSPAAERRAEKRIRRDFSTLFPAWSHVEAAHVWSGMVCLARNRLPFADEVAPGSQLWAGLCYHGNGIAMGTFCGNVLAERILGRDPETYPKALRSPLARFPFGRARRIIMPAAYAGLMLADRF